MVSQPFIKMHKMNHFILKTKGVLSTREIHPLNPQPHRHSMLVPRVCAPRVTRYSLGKYWSRDFSKQAAERLTGWLAGYTDCHPI